MAIHSSRSHSAVQHFMFIISYNSSFLNVTLYQFKKKEEKQSLDGILKGFLRLSVFSCLKMCFIAVHCLRQHDKNVITNCCFPTTVSMNVAKVYSDAFKLYVHFCCRTNNFPNTVHFIHFFVYNVNHYHSRLKLGMLVVSEHFFSFQPFCVNK